MQPDQVAYINLEHRTDRRAFMEKQLAGCPWPVSRIDAVKLQQVEEGYSVFREDTDTAPIAIAAIFQSHMKALEFGLTTVKDGPFLLLEDDCALPSRYWKRHIDMSSTPDWQILMVSTRFKKPELSSETKSGFSFFGKPIFRKKKRKLQPIKGLGPVLLKPMTAEYTITGTHCVYFKNAETMRLVLDHMNAVRQFVDVDSYYISNFKTYGLRISGVRGEGFGSDNRVETDTSDTPTG
ncbi:hypothetical protein [Pseudaestuariivita rosea]|uniref:hypothetical protein n=1 Tax=Pseudaestuariivita rosea TaxID=2763263 RepID=UPI001ABB4897|nr:hypothetical protein [Pseudaestuariivita rosea]